MGISQQEYIARASLTERVRAKMRDYAQLNLLIEGEEHDDQMISFAIDEILSEVNYLPPPVGVFGVKDVPLSLMLNGCISKLLESIALLNNRNHTRVQSGGMSIDTPTGQQDLALAQQFYSKFRRDLDKIKRAMNHQQAVNTRAGAGSAMAFVNARSSDWYSSDLYSGAWY